MPKLLKICDPILLWNSKDNDRDL